MQFQGLPCFTGKKKGLELLGLAVPKKGNGECVGSFRLSSRVVLFVSSEKECVCC